MGWPPTCKFITIISNISQVSEICVCDKAIKIAVIETFFLPVYLHTSYLRPFLKELLPEKKGDVYSFGKQ